MIPLGLVIIPGGIAIGIAAAGGTPESAVPTKQAPNGGALISTGAASSGSTIQGQLTAPLSPVGGRNSKLLLLRGATASSGPIGASPTSGFGSQISPTNGIDSMLQQKLDEIERYAAAAYDKLNDDVKKAGANQLNETLKLDPPLKGDESWEEVSRRAGDEAGAAVGNYFGGPVGAKLGAKVGAYLGVKLEDLVSKNSDEIKAWFKSRWADIEEWVQGIGDDIEQGVKDAIDYLGGLF
jgi:hypothetical protein